MENETRPEDPLSEWRRYEASFPDLQLTHFRDKLDWLYGGEPDHPDVSLENWKLFRTKMSGRKANEAARQLLKFWEDHPVTFMHSGWVNAALGQIVLEDESASKEFTKPYWARNRRPIPKSTMAAYQVLSLMRGPHREHWLAAVRWMLHFYQENDLPKEKDSRFTDRALIAYWDRADAPEHSCLGENALRAIAMTVRVCPDWSSTKLCDQALATLCRTSPSTLSHLRADINKHSILTRRR